MKRRKAIRVLFGLMFVVITGLYIKNFIGAHEKQITLDSQDPAQLGAHLTDLIPIDDKEERIKKGVHVHMVTDNSTTVRTELTEKTAVHTIQTVSRQETLLGSESVVVIGASSFIGSHLSVSLNSVGYKVLPLEDNVVYNVFDSMIWYRWNQLIDNKFDPMFIDFSDSVKLKSLIEVRNPQVILYIPTLIFDDDEISQDRMSNISLISTHLKHFVQILDFIKESRPQTHVILLSVSQTSIPSRQKAWMKTFEMSLSLYQDSFRASTVRIDQVYGPWKYGNNKESDSSWYIEDIVQSVKDVIHEKEQCVDIDFNCNECKFACPAIIPEKDSQYFKGNGINKELDE